MLNHDPTRLLSSRVWVTATLCLIAQVPDICRAQDASTYYTVQHPEQFKIDWGAFYRQAEKKTTEVRAALPHHLDIPYGPAIKQRLDLYLPTGKPQHAPVFLFLHGGGFREGDRLQYGFVAKPFAAHGIITAVASYRLTGDGAKYPDQPEDARLALAWLYHHAAEYGGDPDRLYLGGHSAGAIIAADLGVDRTWMKEAGIPTRALRGIAPVSGTYDMRTKDAPGETNVYAPTRELQDRASPILHVKSPVPAAVVAVGSEEKAEEFVVSSRQLADKMTAAGAHVKFLSLAGEDHGATVAALGEEQSELFRAVLAMIEGDHRSALR